MTLFTLAHSLTLGLSIYGIEFGQLAVIGIAYAVVAAAWKRDWYCAAVARPASAVIAASGLYWAVERAGF